MTYSQQAQSVPQHPLRLMYRMYKYILPEVGTELEGLRQRAGQIPDSELRRQALDSIASKKFHCQGGAIYATADRKSVV